MAGPWRAAPLVALLCLIPGLAGAAPEVRSLIVKLRGEGPHALAACAERAFSRGEPLAAYARDRSDSLDRLQAELGVRGVRALFRRSDGSPFERQRQVLSARLHHALAARRGAAPARRLPDLAHVYRVELESGADLAAAVRRLRADPHVEYAQPNYAVETDALLSDPFLHSSGSWGQPYPDQWGIHAIDAARAWDHTRGAGVTIAVVDTGVDLQHPDIAPNLWVNPGEDLDANGRADATDRNGIDDDGNGLVDDLQGYDFHDQDADPSDENGHGTHVAGIAAARGDNGLGIAGVAPEARILPVRVFPPSGSAETAVIWRGVLYAALAGADVVNGSFSCGTVCRSNPLAEEVMDVLAALGVVYVTSAGNAASDVMLKSPERLHQSIVVGSIQPSQELAPTSSFGLLVDVVAPGDDVLSLRARAAAEHYSPLRFVGDDLMRLSGTSMAAPHVSGAIALLLAADPELTAEGVRGLLRGSALDLGEPGHDREFGAGLLAAAGALAGLPIQASTTQIVEPLPGDTLAQPAGPVPVVATLRGESLRRAWLELGRGGAPTSWEPLSGPLLPPFEGREIARLELSDYADGAYVLRLRAERVDGSEELAFAPISLERSTPVLVSSGGRLASNAALDGRTLVWEASERGDDEAADPGRGVYQGRFGVEGERLLAGGPGDQTRPALAGRWMAFLEEPADGELPGNRVLACRRAARCREQVVAESAHDRSVALQLSRHWLVYQQRLGGLFVCRLGPTGCTSPHEVAVAEPAGLSDLRLDAQRLVWSVFTPGGVQISQCALTTGGEPCRPRGVDTSGIFLPAPVGLSGDLLALSGFTIAEPTAGLFLCQLDREGGCTADLALRVTDLPALGAVAPDLADGRLVWHDRGAHGQTDVFFCEYDRAAGHCQIQTLTHDAANQRNPRLQGTRIVWEDDRDGSQRIASFELPRLQGLRDLELRPGRRVRMPVRAWPARPQDAISATLDGLELPALGARLVSSGTGSALFDWRPAAKHRGRHTLRVRVTRAGGLYTERSVELRVAEPLRAN